MCMAGTRTMHHAPWAWAPARLQTACIQPLHTAFQAERTILTVPQRPFKNTSRRPLFALGPPTRRAEEEPEGLGPGLGLGVGVPPPPPPPFSGIPHLALPGKDLYPIAHGKGGLESDICIGDQGCKAGCASPCEWVPAYGPTCQMLAAMQRLEGCPCKPLCLLAARPAKKHEYTLFVCVRTGVLTEGCRRCCSARWNLSQ